MTTNTHIAAQLKDALDHIQSLERVPGQTMSTVQFHATKAANSLRAVLPAIEAAELGEASRPDILEKLTYHQLERDDMTLDDCLSFLAHEWRKVHGRSDRQMVMQILSLLASTQPQAPALDAQGEAAPRNIIWDSRHPDYPVEWSNPGRPAREGEVHYIRYDIFSNAMHKAKFISTEDKRKLIAAAGFVTGPNFDTPQGRLYRSAGTATNVWERDLFDLIDGALYFAPLPNAVGKPLSDEQILSMCAQSWVFETVKQWVRIVETHHGIVTKETGNG